MAVEDHIGLGRSPDDATSLGARRLAVVDHAIGESASGRRGDWAPPADPSGTMNAYRASCFEFYSDAAPLNGGPLNANPVLAAQAPPHLPGSRPPVATQPPADPFTLSHLFGHFAAAPPAVDVQAEAAKALAALTKTNELLTKIAVDAVAAEGHANGPKVSAGLGLTNQDLWTLGMGNTTPEMRAQIMHKASVQRLADSAQGNFDPKMLTNELEALSDPAERAKVLADVASLTGHTLQESIAKNTKPDDHFRLATNQLLSDERTQAEQKMAQMSPAAREAKHKWAIEQALILRGELAKSKPDNAKVFDTLGFIKDKGDKDDDAAVDTEAVRQAFREVAPELGGLVSRIDEKMGGDNEREAIADLDMTKGARVKQAAAALRNSFTGAFSDNNRTRMKEALDKLTPAEIDALQADPEGAKVLKDVQNTMHGLDRVVVDSYVRKDKDLARGQQLAEDIFGNASHVVNQADGDKLDTKALFAKLKAKYKDDPKELAAAVAAFDHAHKNDPKALSLSVLMAERFEGYERDRGAALLRGDMAGANAAQAEDALDRKKVDSEALEDSLTDPDLDPALAKSGSKEDQDKYRAAKRRHDDMEQTLASKYHKGTLLEQAHQKLQPGTDDRLALDNVEANGDVGFTIKLKRSIADGNTEKTKELLEHGTVAQVDEATKTMPTLEGGKSLHEQLQREWGPKLRAGLLGVERQDADGNYLAMMAVAEHGARSTWTPEFRASIDKQVHDANRGRWGAKELTGDDMSGRIYDRTTAEEVASAKAGDKGEKFKGYTESTEAAATSRAAQREADAEEVVSGLKMTGTLVTLALAPELAPVVGPLMSLASVGLKEEMLGKNYKGEKNEMKLVALEAIISAVTLGAQKLLELRKVAEIAKGLKGVKTAEDVEHAAEVAAEGQGAVSKGLGVAGKTKAEVEEAAAARMETGKLVLESGSVMADSGVRGKIEGKGYQEILRGMLLSLGGLHASNLAGTAVHDALSKGGAAKAKAAGGAADYRPGMGHHLAVGTTKAAVGLGFDAAAKGAGSGTEVFTTLFNTAATHTLGHGQATAAKTTSATKELHEEAAAARARNKGILSVEDARSLQEKAARLGVKNPGIQASTTEEVLRKKGMSDKELALYKDSVNRDQQATLTEQEIRKRTEAAGKRYAPGNHKDVDGTDRKRLDRSEQLPAVMKANALQYEDVKNGERVVKVIPTGQVGQLLFGEGEFGAPKLTGDVSRAVNTERLGAEGRVQHVGLDYETSGEHPFVTTGKDGKTSVREDVKKRLFQVEDKLDVDSTAAAKVVFGPDEYAYALEQAHVHAEMHAWDENHVIPKLFELDKSGNLVHIDNPRVRANEGDPSTGMGGTASQRLRDQDGNKYFAPNQELHLTKVQPYHEGAELVTIDEKGTRKVVATYDEKTHAFKLSPSLSDGEAHEYLEMMHKQEEHMKDFHAQKAAEKVAPSPPAAKQERS